MGYACLVHSLYSFRRWLQRIDRQRSWAFLRFLFRRFLDDNSFPAASALSYTTLLALVPLTATVLGVIALFPIHRHWRDVLTIFLFEHFVPKAAASVVDYIHTFASSARGLTGFGAIGLLATSLLTMSSIENAFNQIWRVDNPRRPVARFIIYWIALTLGPILAMLSLGTSIYLFTLPMVSAAEQPALSAFGLRLLPVILEIVAFSAAYKLIPHRTVRMRHALAGGVLATVLFTCAKYAVALYLARASYQQVYGTLAAIPIFLLWIWVSWLVVLLGATFASALPAFQYRVFALRMRNGFELYPVLRVLGRFAQADERTRGLRSAELLELEPILTDDVLQSMLAMLRRIGVLRRNKSGAWLLARDLNELDVEELYEAASLRIPLSQAAWSDGDDALGICIREIIDAMRTPLREQMHRSVGSIFPLPEGRIE